MPSIGGLPERFLEDFFYARRRLVERLSRARGFEEVEAELVRAATLLAPIVATCGPAGPNAAPFMVSFMVREEVLGETLERLRRFADEYWGRGREAVAAATRLLLDTVYNPGKADPTRLVSHIMSRGHTWENIRATGRATLAILIPPDRGAYEIRARASIIEEGPVYEYANLLHDLMHAVPEGERSHPWYPAVLFEIEEIYDNSYQALGKKIYP